MVKGSKQALFSPQLIDVLDFSVNFINKPITPSWATLGGLAPNKQGRGYLLWSPPIHHVHIRIGQLLYTNI